MLREGFTRARDSSADSLVTGFGHGGECQNDGNGPAMLPGKGERVTPSRLPSHCPRAGALGSAYDPEQKGADSTLYTISKCGSAHRGIGKRLGFFGRVLPHERTTGSKHGKRKLRL